MGRESRKLEHIKEALKQQELVHTSFDDLLLIHNPISEGNYFDLSLETAIGELPMSSPILINAMTGGAYDTKEINRSLSIVAKELSIPIAVGSQMAAIKDPSLRDTYQVVREYNPDGIVIANLGQEATLEEAKLAIEMIDANAIQIHLNIMQEMIMPEGDRDFSNLQKRISRILEHISIPVIIKEVGFGMNTHTAAKLKELGARILDVGGQGGTNFAKIENARGGNRLDFLNSWGIPTPISILEVQMIEGLTIIGSGGIRNGLDIVKCLALGAVAVGIAGPLLKKLHTSGIDGVIDFIRELQDQMRLIMTALGVKHIVELHKVPIIVMGNTLIWCNERGIDTKKYARNKLF